VENGTGAIIMKEGLLVHNVFKLFRLEIATMNAISTRLAERQKRAKRSEYQERFQALQHVTNDAKLAINEGLHAIKKVRKDWKNARSLHQAHEDNSALARLDAGNNSLLAILEGNGSTIGNTIKLLTDQTYGLLSRKSQIGDIVDDAPERLAGLESVRETLLDRAVSVKDSIIEILASNITVVP